MLKNRSFSFSKRFQVISSVVVVAASVFTFSNQAWSTSTDEFLEDMKEHAAHLRKNANLMREVADAFPRISGLRAGIDQAEADAEAAENEYLQAKANNVSHANKLVRAGLHRQQGLRQELSGLSGAKRRAKQDEVEAAKRATDLARTAHKKKQGELNQDISTTKAKARAVQNNAEPEVSSGWFSTVLTTIGSAVRSFLGMFVRS